MGSNSFSGRNSSCLVFQKATITPYQVKEERMTQKISVLVNDIQEVPAILQDLRSAGIPTNEIELIHRRSATLQRFFTNPKETPRISDQDVNPILRNSNTSDEDIRYCEMRMENGATLLTLNVPENQMDKVLSLMKQHRVSIPNEKDAVIGQVLRKGQLIGKGAPKDFTKLEKLESLRVRVTDFTPQGWDVKDPKDNKIGDIKFVVGNPTTGQPYFAVVDVGGLFKDKLIVLPFDALSFDLDEKEVVVPFNKEQIKAAPNFTEKELDYRKFSSYWDQIRETELYAHSER